MLPKTNGRIFKNPFPILLGIINQGLVGIELDGTSDERCRNRPDRNLPDITYNFSLAINFARTCLQIGFNVLGDRKNITSDIETVSLFTFFSVIILGIGNSVQDSRDRKFIAPFMTLAIRRQ